MSQSELDSLITENKFPDITPILQEIKNNLDMQTDNYLDNLKDVNVAINSNLDYILDNIKLLEENNQRTTSDTIQSLVKILNAVDKEEKKKIPGLLQNLIQKITRDYATFNIKTTEIKKLISPPGTDVNALSGGKKHRKGWSKTYGGYRYSNKRSKRSKHSKYSKHSSTRKNNY
jgi:hypothetical protein